MTHYNCPICNSTSHLLDVVDFNKNCEEQRGKFLPKSGIPVYYVSCPACEFIFAPEFSNWTDEDFSSKIYNASYIDIDPDYPEIRPQTNYGLLQRFFGGVCEQINHLDYGGGSGKLSEMLSSNGWNSSTYDPFPVRDQEVPSLDNFNLITAFEVFEHVPNPIFLMENIKQLIQNDGMIFFSTLINDNNIKSNQRLDWWYASPRNGHISLYSSKSLKLLGEKYGFNFASLGVGYHVYFKNFPSWAKSLLSA